jgi:hypothetical protein
VRPRRTYRPPRHGVLGRTRGYPVFRLGRVTETAGGAGTEDRVGMRNELNVVPRILPDGFLELFSPHTGKSHRCGPTGALMWLALQRLNWDPELASLEIATQLDVDPASIRCEVDAWLAHFREAIR